MKNCYLYLSRDNLFIDNSVDTFFINDYLTYSDEYCIDSNFINLTKTVKTPCSWDKAFLYIKENSLLNKYDYFWFIEDDVYLPNKNILKNFDNNTEDLLTDVLDLIAMDKQCLWRKWYLIQKDIKYFNYTSTGRTFNPLCRLSNRLIKNILDFQEINQTFIFHEILFPSLAIQNKYSLAFFKHMTNYIDMFGHFWHRPVINSTRMPKNKINHPVKDLYKNN